MTYDSDLAWIAASAAIELDKASKGIKKDFKNTKKLTDFIGTQVSNADNNRIDPVLGWIAFDSVYAAFGGPVPSLISEYAFDLKKVYKKMRQVDSLSSEWLEALANFSCSLSQYAIAGHWENMPGHPNKRYWLPSHSPLAICAQHI